MTNANREITSDEIATFERDGVVCLSGLFNDSWIELLNKGLDANCQNPTQRSRIWDRDEQGRTMFWDRQAWQNIEEYRKFIYQSPAASIAGALMNANKINFFFDAVFVRSPGANYPI